MAIAAGGGLGKYLGHNEAFVKPTAGLRLGRVAS
jgi:hypothetical protein